MGPSTLSTLPTGTFFESSTKITSCSGHSSSSTRSTSSFGALLFCLLAGAGLGTVGPPAGLDKLPSLHVEEAGDGGGGIGGSVVVSLTGVLLPWQLGYLRLL